MISMEPSITTDNCERQEIMNGVTVDVNEYGIAHAIHPNDGYQVHVLYYWKSADAVSQYYSCWVTLNDGRRSVELCLDDGSHPLTQIKVIDAIHEFVTTTLHTTGD